MTCKIDQILNAAATVHLAKLQHFCSDNEMDQFLYIHYLNLATVWKKKENWEETWCLMSLRNVTPRLVESDPTWSQTGAGRGPTQRRTFPLEAEELPSACVISLLYPGCARCLWSCRSTKNHEEIANHSLSHIEHLRTPRTPMSALIKSEKWQRKDRPRILSLFHSIIIISNMISSCTPCSNFCASFHSHAIFFTQSNVAGLE